MGQTSAPYPNSKYHLVEPRLLDVKMCKPKPEKAIKKTSLSPCSYQNNHSFKETQVRKPNIYISKYKNENFIEKAVRLNKWKLSPGAHDHTKGYNVMTKGLAKGWK